jgi:hypothetical protein
MKEIIVHAGSFKTGSSAIQYALFRNLRVLEESNFSYPMIQANYGFGWQAERGMISGNVPTVLPDGTSEDLLKIEKSWRDSLLAIADDNHQKLILSQENLSGMLHNEFFWRELAEFCMATNRRPLVVVYLREPLAFLNSMYEQEIKNAGLSATFQEWLKLALTSKRRTIALYVELLTALDLAKQYKVEFKVLCFETFRPNLVKHFFDEILGLPFHHIEFSNEIINPSLGRYEVEFQRGLNSNSKELGEILGWERSDLLRKKHHKVPNDFFAGKRVPHIVDLESQVTLKAFLASTVSRMKDSGIWSEEVKEERRILELDYKNEQTSLLPYVSDSLPPEEEKYLGLLFSLGQLVASSYDHGYIKWYLDNHRRK